METQRIRDRIWDELDESGEARFPFPPHNRIPNFADADEAAARLAARPEWQAATAIKANPDAPQRFVRRRALGEGKTVYMAVPRLRDEECFVELDPNEIDDLDRASTISGAAELGVQVGPDAVDRIDLIVSGSVAVSEDGARIGKGEGYSDLEYAILRELGLVDARTPVVTTIHELQVVDDDWHVDDHDVPMDLLVTPERVIQPAGSDEKPAGINWGELSDERIAEMPVLSRMRA